ncbi:MAG: hypothetical protein QOF48_499 [Verrucomicrobiota bacterium]|jgi:hypothetical protein
MKPEITDQEELQRMLALKRHEQPPKRFFKGLSTAVIDRLQHPEPLPPPTFWQRLGLDFDRKPVIVCILGVTVCGLLAYALVLSRNVKGPPPDPVSDTSVPSLVIRSTPGQMDSAPPLRPPGTKPNDMSRTGDAVTVTPPPADSLIVRPWPTPPPPVPAGK